MQADATKFPYQIPAISRVSILATFLTFTTFQHSFQLWILPYLSLTKALSTTARRSLCPIRTTGATNHKSFMWLQLLTSLSPNADFWRRNLGAPQLRNIATPTIANHHQRRRRHAASND